MRKDCKKKKLGWIRCNFGPLMVFLLGLLFSSLVTIRMYHIQNQFLHVKARAQAETLGRYFAQALEKRIAISETLTALLYDNDGDYKRAISTAEKIFSIHREELSSVQFAPNGKVSFIYPLEGNERGFLDLFAEEDRRAEAEYSRDHRIITVAGPFHLRQGGNGIAIRNPVFIPDEAGTEHFWGFATVIVNSDRLLEEIDIHHLQNEGYDYRLLKVDEWDRKSWIVTESTARNLEDAECYEFFVPGYSMKMSVRPIHGWVPWYVLIPLFTGLMTITVLVSILSILFQKTKAQNTVLKNQSETDALTGLLNRRGGDRQMMEYLSDNRNANGVLLAIDIDIFKRMNDLYGHVAGDKALVMLAKKLQETFGEDAIYIRNGGDEFQVFIPDVSVRHIRPSIENLASQRFSFYFGKKPIEFSISIGYAVYPDQAVSFSELCQEADAALYFVKMNGRKNAMGFESSMKTESRSQLGFNLMDIATGIPGALLIYRAREEKEEILFANSGLVELFECESMKDFMDYVGSSFKNVVHPLDRERVYESIWEQIDDPKNQSVDRVEFRIVTRSGRVRAVRDIGRLVNSPYYGDLFYVFLYPED